MAFSKTKGLNIAYNQLCVLWRRENIALSQMTWLHIHSYTHTHTKIRDTHIGSSAINSYPRIVPWTLNPSILLVSSLNFLAPEIIGTLKIFLSGCVGIQFKHKGNFKYIWYFSPFIFRWVIALTPFTNPLFTILFNIIKILN